MPFLPLLPNKPALRFASLTAAAALLAACQSTPWQAEAGDHAKPAPALKTPASDDSADATALSSQAQAQAQRLSAAMAQSNGAVPAASQPGTHASQPAPAAPPQQVQWLTPSSSPAAAAASPAPAVKPVAPAPAEPAVTAPALVQDTPQAPQPATAPQPAAAQPLDRAALLEQLRQTVARSKESQLTKALTAAALTLADPNPVLPAAAVESLTPAQKKSVSNYHKLLVELARQIASSDESLSRSEIDRHMDAVFGEQSLAVRSVQLCKRVRGFGVYEPFDSNSFLAGVDQPAIVYVELENFKASPAQGEKNLYQVMLTQELVLYSAADGLKVWASEPVRITDESRNIRRDFFLVQKITLPRNLSVGRYRLKVTVRDTQGESVDEAIVPIEIVADKSLVKGP